MSMVLDLVLIAIIAGICLNGYMRGLMLSLFNLISSFGAIIISFIFYMPLANVLKLSPVYNWIYKPVYESCFDLYKQESITTVEGFSDKLRLPGSVADRIISQVNESGVGANGVEMVEKTSDLITIFIIQIIAAVLIFIIIKIAFMFLRKFVKGITSIPIIRQADKAGGIVFGLLEAFVLLTVTGALFALFNGQFDSSIISMVDSSVVGKFFYHNNFLISFLS